MTISMLLFMDSWIDDVPNVNQRSELFSTLINFQNYSDADRKKFSRTCTTLHFDCIVLQDTTTVKIPIYVLFREWRVIFDPIWLEERFYPRMKKLESTELQKLVKSSLKSAVSFQKV